MKDKMKKYKFGLRGLSPKDSRDYKYLKYLKSDLAKNREKEDLPIVYDPAQLLSYSGRNAYDGLKELLPRDQGEWGTCGAFTASAIISEFHRRETGEQKYMSPAWLYKYRSMSDHDMGRNQDTGMIPIELCKFLHKCGAVSEESFPYNKKNIEDALLKDSTEMYLMNVQNYNRLQDKQKVRLKDLFQQKIPNNHLVLQGLLS